MPAIHVNVPYPILLQRMDFLLGHRIHPEIYFSAETLDSFDENEGRRAAEEIRAGGLEVSFHGPFLDLSPGGLDRRVREVTVDRFARTLDIARIFRPNSIVFHPGYEKWKFNGDVGLWLKGSLDTWRGLAERAGEQGTVIALENVFEETPEPLKTLLGEIASPSLRWCFDSGHQRVFSRTATVPWFEALGSHLHEMHLHDNHGEMDDHLPAGEGGFDFAELFGLLDRKGLHPVYTIEPHEEAHLWRGLKAVGGFLDRRTLRPGEAA
jgi:sugar phosphate isomerase/epimerase